MKIYKYLFVVSFCVVTACTPPKPMEELPINKIIPLKQRTNETATISSWEIDGAIAAKNKSKGWSATLNWMQHGSTTYQIRFIGPLGSGTVLIKRNGNVITLQDGSKIIKSTNADELLWQQTGIRLPVNNLYYWVRGMSAPGKAQLEVHDKYNHLVKLQQDGYLIEFTKYTSVKNIDLPSIIHLKGNGMTVKVIIKNWHV